MSDSVTGQITDAFAYSISQPEQVKQMWEWRITSDFYIDPDDHTQIWEHWLVSSGARRHLIHEGEVVCHILTGNVQQYIAYKLSGEPYLTEELDHAVLTMAQFAEEIQRAQSGDPEETIKAPEAFRVAMGEVTKHKQLPLWENFEA